MRTAAESNTKTKRPSGASMLLIAVLDRFVILIKVNTLQPYTDISSIIINNMLSYICIVPLSSRFLHLMLQMSIMVLLF